MAKVKIRYVEEQIHIAEDVFDIDNKWIDENGEINEDFLTEDEDFLNELYEKLEPETTLRSEFENVELI